MPQLKFGRSVERRLKDRFLPFLENRLGKPLLQPSDLDTAKIHRILVIKSHDQLGDLLLATPVFRALKTHFHKAHLTAIVRSYTFELLHDHPFIDEVLCFHEHVRQWTPLRLYRFLKRLRSGYDLAIVLNTVSHSFTADLLAHMSRAPFILGPENLKFTNCQRNFFYNLISPVTDAGKHQTELYLDILKYIGVQPAGKNEEINLTDKELNFARQFLMNQKIKGKWQNLRLFLHIGAGKPGNRWPVGNFIQVARYFRKRFNAIIVVSWGRKEGSLGSQFLANLDFAPILAINLKLRELAAVIACCNLAICNDTGIMHLAASVQTPVIAIFGPTDPGRWKPLNENVFAIRGKFNQTKNVSVNEVIRQSRKLINTPEQILA